MFETRSRRNNIVEVVDSMMGTGKTTNILKWMDANPNNKYIYVSPLLSEVGEGCRVHKELKNVTLEIPNNVVSNKSDSLLSMLLAGDSIACTHSLYLSMREPHFKAILDNEYIVVIDEEVDVIGGFDRYSSNDLKWLLQEGEIEISEVDGSVSWVGERELIKNGHKYSDFLQYCDSNSLYSSRRSASIMVTQLPIKLFECAKQVIILTYLFDGNVLDCFLKLKGFEVKKFKGVEVTPSNMQEVRDLITVIPPTSKMEGYSLSSSWWKEASSKQINDVSNFIRTNARNYDLKGRDVLWTAPKNRSVSSSGNKNIVKPSGYIVDATDGTSCYLSATTRATNEYDHKRAMFHCYNRFPLVSISSYLQDYGHPVDLEVFATSELVQWLWRGCIRRGEPMIVGIASKRMYGFFMNWLNEDLDEKNILGGVDGLVG